MDDRELLEHYYADSNNQWLGILLSRYSLLLMGVCMKYLKNQEEAKDAVQQIFYKVISDMHKYRVNFFKSWIYMVAKNHCLMRLREKGRFFVEVNDNILSLQEDTESREENIEKEKELTELESELAQLNTEQRQCLTLFYLQRKSYIEVAAATNFTVMQVKSHIQNGKRNLKIILEKKQNEG